MADADARTFTLKVDPDADPIAGSIAAEDGSMQSFVGWLGLASALGEWLTRESPHDPLGPESGDPPAD